MPENPFEIPGRQLCTGAIIPFLEKGVTGLPPHLCHNQNEFHNFHPGSIFTCSGWARGAGSGVPEGAGPIQSGSGFKTMGDFPWPAICCFFGRAIAARRAARTRKECRRLSWRRNSRTG